MKILTLLGTRPEIIRLSRIIPKLDEACQHILVHTGQNFSPNMSDIFFEQLELRQPDYFLNIAGADLGEQLGNLFSRVHRLLKEVPVDRLLILGDTNSALSALIAQRLGIKVYHMEAGNRCFRDTPEEINRRVVDSCSDVWMPYTERSRANLIREGYSGNRIFVIGNPIKEVIDYQLTREGRQLSDVFGQPNAYFLVTLHREENVDSRPRLAGVLEACANLKREYGLPIIFSRHPRTAMRMREWGLTCDAVEFHEPFGFWEFLELEGRATCVLSDSGTVQEECCIRGVPCVTLRDVTERPETIECGSNIVSGTNPDTILQCVRLAVNNPCKWRPPWEYMRTDVSETVVKLLLGN